MSTFTIKVCGDRYRVQREVIGPKGVVKTELWATCDNADVAERNLALANRAIARASGILTKVESVLVEDKTNGHRVGVPF